MNDMISDEELARVRVPTSTRQIMRNRAAALARPGVQSFLAARKAARQRDIDEKYAYASYGPFANQVVDGPRWTRLALKTLGTFGAPYPEDEFALQRNARYHLVKFMEEEGINPAILREWMRLHPRLRGPKGRERVEEFEKLLKQVYGGVPRRKALGSWIHRSSGGGHVLRDY